MRASVGFTLAFLLVAAGAAPAALAAAPVEPASCRSIPVDADGPLRADIARERFGVDGTGVTVGVISDSFSATVPPIATVADDVANGLLPGPGNPCGHETPVTVLRDVAQGNDEGRAMLQLVHGIAPGARLMFASAGGPSGDEGITEAIDLLAAAGADVIVDDVSTTDDAVFQRSLAGEAIARATSRGAVYLSSAANATAVAKAPRPGQMATPVNGWETTAYRPMPCPEAVVAAVVRDGRATPVDCLDVDPGEGTDATLNYVAGLPGTSSVLLYWGEPVGRVSGLFVPVVSIDGEVVSAETKPFDEGTPGFSITLPVIPRPVDIDISVARVSVPDAATSLPEPPISIAFSPTVTMGSAEYWRSTGDDTVGRTIAGHNGDPGVITVAAASSRTPLEVKDFSSLGPVTWFYGSAEAAEPSAPLDPPLVLAKPDILAVDDVRTSVLHLPTDDPGVFVFDGTSAAAPNAAGVAALMLALRPDADQEDVRAALTSTATPAPSPWELIPARDVTGAGLVNAEAALAAIAPAPTPTPTPTPEPEPTPEPSVQPTGQPTSSTAPTATASPLPVPLGAGPTHLASTGTDSTRTEPVALAALTLLTAGGLVLLAVRVRARRR